MLRRAAVLFLIAGCQVDPPVEEAAFFCETGTCPVEITVEAAVPQHQIRLTVGREIYACATAFCSFDLPPLRRVTLAVVPERTVRWYRGEEDLGLSSTIAFDVHGPEVLRVDFRPNPDTFRPDAPNVLLLLDDSASMMLADVEGVCPYDLAVHGEESPEPDRSTRAAAMRAALNGCEDANDGALRRFADVNLGIVEVGAAPRLIAPLGSDLERLQSAVGTLRPEATFALHEGLDVAVAHADEAISERKGAADGRLHVVLFADGVDTGSPTHAVYRWACNGPPAVVRQEDGFEATLALLRHLAQYDVLCELAGSQRVRLHLVSFVWTPDYASTVTANGGRVVTVRTVGEARGALDEVLAELR